MTGPLPPAAAARGGWCQVAAEGLVAVEFDNKGADDSTGQFRPWGKGPISAVGFLPYIFCSVLLCILYCVLVRRLFTLFDPLIL